MASASPYSAAAAHVLPPALRKSSRCPHCKLNQFELASGLCRRCRGELYPPVEPLPVAVSLAAAAFTPDPLPVSPPVLPSHPLSFWIPAALLFLRLRSGQSQSQIAKRIPTPRTYISKVENGCLDITLVSLERYAEALNTTPWDVLRLCEWLMQESE